MVVLALLQTSSVTPVKWIELLSTYGPAALFVFGVFVLLAMAKPGPPGPQQRIQLVALSFVWIGIFVLGVVIVVAWWRGNIRSEFVVKGKIRNLRDGEIVTTSQEMYMRVHPIASKDFEYQWRFITPEKFSDNVTLILYKHPGSYLGLKYNFPILADYYTGTADVDIAYDRMTDEMTVSRGGRVDKKIAPAAENASNSPQPYRRNSSIVYAQNDSGRAPVVDLIQSLDADNPVIREKALRDVAARGDAALPEIEKALGSGSSPRLRAGTIAALIVMTQNGKASLPDSMRCAVASLAAADPDRFVRSTAWRLIEAGVRPGRGCTVPQAIDELKTGWAPLALAYHPESGFFALDEVGRVYRVAVGEKNAAIYLFSIPPSTRPLDLAAGPHAVAVVGTTHIGQLFVYTLATGKLSPPIALPVRRFGTGVAMDAGTIYVGTSSNNGYEVEAWDVGSGRQQPRVWQLPGFQSLGSMILDEEQNKLVICDPSASRVSTLTLTDGKIKLLSDQVGAVTAGALTTRYYLLGSGGKILFLSRLNGMGQNPPPGVKAIVFKYISGLAVDKFGDLWVSDFSRMVIKGPIVLP